jgi:hypothetical protein
MTTKNVPRICDACGSDIESEQQYKLQFSQRMPKGSKKAKGKFVKAGNDADMCHPCFIEFCKHGFKPDWVTLEKDDSGKWVVLEEA